MSQLAEDLGPDWPPEVTGAPADHQAWSILRRRADRGLILVDLQWRIRHCDDAAAANLLRRPARLGENFWDVIRPMFDVVARRRFRKALQLRRVADAVLAVDGGGWLHVEFVPDEDVCAVIGRDASREVRARATARRQEARTRALNESLTLAHRAARAATWEWRAGSTLRWTDVQAAQDLIGIPRPWNGARVPRDWIEVVLPEDRVALQTALARAAEVGEGRFAFRVVGADARLRWLEAHAVVAERDAAGAPVRLVGVTLDITERRQWELALEQEVAERRRAEERQRLLVAELNHRVKNTLATVQSIARQTLKGGPEMKRYQEQFEGRLLALSWAHDVLTAEAWSGADLRELVERTLLAHEGPAPGRVRLRGPPLRLEPEVALAISLALHELATNALKYGALSRDGGHVEVSWALEGEGAPHGLSLEWREHGGPEVRPPERKGFGTRLLKQALSAELGAPVELHFEPGGLVCRLATRRGVAPDA